jgi:HK97 family phage prohead protease
MIHKNFKLDIDVKEMLSDSRSVEAVVSTQAVDRDDDIILILAWRYDNYMRNPVVLYNHNFASLPVAKCLSLQKDTQRGHLLAKIQFPEAGIFPEADVVYSLIKSGYINSLSVGFQPLKMKGAETGTYRIITECELLEISFVPIPANVEAVIINKGINLNALKKNSEVLDWLDAPEDIFLDWIDVPKKKY